MANISLTDDELLLVKFALGELHTKFDTQAHTFREAGFTALATQLQLKADVTWKLRNALGD